MLSTGLALIPFIKFRAWLDPSLTKANNLAKVLGRYLERPGSLRWAKLRISFLCNSNFEFPTILTFRWVRFKTNFCLQHTPEVFALKHESRILGQWSNPVSGSRKSQASSPWAKQYRLTCSIMEKPHTGLDECPRILLLCSRARNSALNTTKITSCSR